MKKITSIITILVLSVGFVACTSTEDTKPKGQTSREETNQDTPQLPEISPDSTWVSLGITLEEEPLTKASSLNDLYAVQVYQMVPVDRTTTLGDKYIANLSYAYGYFDDLSKAVFKMSKSYTYAVIVAYIPNGKNVLYKYSDGHYGNPCSSIYFKDGSLNEIIYPTDGSEYMYMIQFGSSQAKDNKEWGLSNTLWNSIERYQGFVEKFDPKESSTVNVDLYRRMIGFRITVSDFEKGSVSIKGDGITYTIDAPTSGTTATKEFIIETPNMPVLPEFPPYDYYAYGTEDEATEEYKEKCRYQREEGWDSLYILYTDSSGDTITLYANDCFTYIRNTMYTLSFSLSDAIRNGGITTTVVDGTDMAEEEFQL